MKKTVKIEEIIKEVSELYRSEIKKVSDMNKELTSVWSTLEQHNKDGGKNITVADYEELNARKTTLEKDIELQNQYCKGIFMTRELLMDLGFDTTVRK